MLALVIRTRRLRARSWAAPPASAVSCHSGSSEHSSRAAAWAWDQRRSPGSRRSSDCTFQTASPCKTTRLVCKTAPPCTKAPTIRRQVSPPTSSGEPSGNAGSRSGLGAAGVNSHGWPPVWYQHWESLHHISGDTIRIRAVMVEQPGEVREALTRSLDEFRVQFERNHRNGEVSQVQFQSTGNDVDVSIGTGADVGLLPVWFGEIRMKWCPSKCKRGFLHVWYTAYKKQQTSVKGQPHVFYVLWEARHSVQTFRFHPCKRRTGSLSQV